MCRALQTAVFPLVCRCGSLRDQLRQARPLHSSLRKYGGQGRAAGLQLVRTPVQPSTDCTAVLQADLRRVGWQLITALRFLQDRGLAHGNLHAGNIVLEGEQVNIRIGLG